MAAVLCKFAQDLQVYPVEGARPGSMACDDMVERKVGHGGPGRRAGLPVGGRDAGNGVIVGEFERLRWTLHETEFQTRRTADAFLEPHALHPGDVLDEPKQRRR